MLPDYILPHHTPPPASPPTLAVNAKGRVYFSKALLHRLGLRTSQPIDLLAPSADCPAWQLDLRPTASRRITWHENTCPRIDRVRLPADCLAPGTRLTLALLPGSVTSPGLYQLATVPEVAAP